jgi:hypothetical protein
MKPPPPNVIWSTMAPARKSTCRSKRRRARISPTPRSTVALGVGEGADFRAPLGRAVIGGTITSTFLTLLVIPTVYEIMMEWREKVRGLFRKKSAVKVDRPAEAAR